MSSYSVLVNESDSLAREHDIEGNPPIANQKMPCIVPSTMAFLDKKTLGTILKVSSQLLLCSVLVANLLALALIFKSTTRETAPTNSATALFNLDLKKLDTRYGVDVSYMTLDPKNDWLWSADKDKHAGLIKLDPPNLDGSTRWGAITMFHQLHCLSSLRSALQRASNGEDIGLDYHDDAHWPHCLHYLRQAIICQADDTIEVAPAWNSAVDTNGTETTKRVGAIDGSGDPRSCRDTSELDRILAERGYREDGDE